MSAKLRKGLWNEINTSWARKKGTTASRGGEYFNKGEIRIVKSQFDAKMQEILDKKFKGKTITPVPVVDTDFNKLRASIYASLQKEDTGSKSWTLAKTHRSKGNATLIAISYIRNTRKDKVTPRAGNIEQQFSLAVKKAIKDYLKNAGADVTNIEYEHGKTRESSFEQNAPQQMEFGKAPTKAFVGAQGSNAEQVSYMELDKYIREGGADKISKDKRLLGSVDKVLTLGLDKIFGISTDLSKKRTKDGIRDTLIMQGEMVPEDLVVNPGTVDKKIKDQVEALLKDQATFVKLAVESKAKKSEDGAEQLFRDSPGPLTALDALSKKQIVSGMFSHKSNPDMRLRVNKRLLEEGKKAVSRGRSKTKPKRRRATFASKATAAGAVKSKGKRSTNTMKTGGAATNPMALKALLNEVLPAQVAQNMQSPALQFRTGRFANNVRVQNITQGPRGGNTMIETSYQNDPYETFARGGKMYTPQRDPDRLIRKSVRQVAMGILGGRFGVNVL